MFVLVVPELNVYKKVYNHNIFKKKKKSNIIRIRQINRYRQYIYNKKKRKIHFE